ncbi:MAG: hypothetical protein IJ706_10395 [Clostridia bacterium]|jgi:predicted transport protein|nr:hypothetical protein [Clostridia bacterium]MBR1677702.1 hypothetical protein [Clostridia bacterium]
MRTFLGAPLSDAVLQNGFFATVNEEGFELNDEILSACKRDMQRYYPEEFAEMEELAAMDSAALVIDEMGEAPAPTKPKYVPSPTFAEKMLRADELLQDRYDELKNYALRFKKLKARISKKFDSINQGRLQFVKLSVAGKTLKLYLNMDINSIDPKFHCKDVSDKKTYVTVPVLLRVKSGRALKYAKILIDQCAEQHGLKENPKFVEIDAIAAVEAFMAE